MSRDGQASYGAYVYIEGKPNGAEVRCYPPEEAATAFIRPS